ncbi:MAG: transposase [Nanoarchaeota archaeon]
MKVYDKEPEPQKTMDEWANFEAEEPFNWRAYNNSQTREKIIVLNLLKELASMTEGNPYAGKGRHPQPVNHMIFCMCFKVYSGLSARRLISDLELCRNKNFINSVPHFNSICNYFDNHNVTKHLKFLIELSALPVAQLETKFAIDSTGFSERKYMERWVSARQKFSMHQQYKKAHCIYGVHSNIIANAIITDGTAADSPRFIELLQHAADNFNVEEISADLAYSSRENLQFADDLNITPYIPFKKNATGKSRGAPAWNRIYKYFKNNREEFMEKYHLRSNAESGFFMIKQRFSDSVMFKDPISQTNEILCKILCHNLCVLAQEIYLSNIEIDFKSCASMMVAH